MRSAYNNGVKWCNSFFIFGGTCDGKHEWDYQ